jgi:hypothetical protein
MSLPASDDAAVVMEPREEPFDLPSATKATQHAAILRARPRSIDPMGRDQFNAVALSEQGIEGIVVVGPITNQARRERRGETFGEGGFDEGGLIRRSAGQVDGDRKTMAVADRHDFAALTASSRAHGGAPFFAELKLASMKVSLRSSLPRSRRSSAKHVSTLRSRPRRCHC